MKILVGLVAAANFIFGIYVLLNALGILQDSKYALSTNWIVAILFTGLAAFGTYALVTGYAKLALWSNLAPWLIGIFAVFLALVLSNPR